MSVFTEETYLYAVILKLPEAASVAALAVSEITVRVHFRDDSFFNVC